MRSEVACCTVLPATISNTWAHGFEGIANPTAVAAARVALGAAVERSPGLQVISGAARVAVVDRPSVWIESVLWKRFCDSICR